jgi:hypothetical protein
VAPVLGSNGTGEGQGAGRAAPQGVDQFISGGVCSLRKRQVLSSLEEGGWDGTR